MSFNAFADSFSKRFQEISSTVQQKAQEAQLDKKLKDLSLSVSQRTQDLTSNLPSLAQTTQRRVQERLGQVTDISQMPEEYVELEQRVDRTKLIYDNFLKVSQIYESESYDYPQHISDSVNDFSKTVTGKVQELTKATTTEEAQSILISPGPARNPKTLNYALSKVALTSSEYLSKSGSDDVVTADILLKYSDVQAKIAQARLQQDTLIQTRFNRRLREKLNTQFAEAMQSRKQVDQKRLQYDIARANFTAARPEKQASLRVQMETLEDQFAQSTEDAVALMQAVIDDTEFLKEFQELVTAQLGFHKAAAELLSGFATVFAADSAVHISSADYK
ncbi:ADL115Wp [Eremothecium gossypii ATCC 10895]|uniref:ADL115Wp n=1 Tax=Eremothecium gossypii (strain ATCC 10895 / CBS 109.51 / FGSC 9923 / NRRL Y-1056) TaxID=284811 RepID=Q75AN7_EREGS|nr:ADL115Wp [Eremothecium gossypii ATCC 10895]AAS51805.1 ADL115Wp [Eremothecium gossypii ATCC 10895]AEY96103.1 FADL115Wp [Eremothecium gossypii FDAG1]